MYSCFFESSIHFDCQSVIYGSELLKPELMYAIMAVHFPISYFLYVNLSESRCIFAWRHYSSPCNSFFTWIIQLGSLCSLCCFILRQFFFFFFLLPLYMVVGKSFCILPRVFTPWEFFTSLLADCWSLELEWQWVFSSLRDSSQYSGRSRSLLFCKFLVFQTRVSWWSFS